MLNFKELLAIPSEYGRRQGGKGPRYSLAMGILLVSFSGRPVEARDTSISLLPSPTSPFLPLCS